ncbi:hypothetical protein MT325_m659L [Paramecium bursaria chlorella virus MT325]|uniref:Uncharacterized protein m659L n=1 Tax=Paramecium bursaria Chlorella virus MT325 TaxID=346932 RepID=A7IV39_PBCVM|nr:hypothetical protein MT325_m659L [Paramecium bursaria chlorella virus MT325]
MVWMPISFPRSVCPPPRHLSLPPSVCPPSRRSSRKSPLKPQSLWTPRCLRQWTGFSTLTMSGAHATRK